MNYSQSLVFEDNSKNKAAQILGFTFPRENNSNDPQDEYSHNIF